MDKQKAIQKIQACLNIYKCATAPQGERDAAWERANHIAAKYRLKIVKQEPKRQPEYQHFDLADWIREMERNRAKSSSNLFKTFDWEPKNANGKRVRDMYVFMAYFSGMKINYSKGSRSFIVTTDIDPVKVRQFLDKYYKIIDKMAIRFTKDLKESLHVDGRDITGQKASKVFSICFVQLCRMGDNEAGRNAFFSLISGERTTLKMLYDDVNRLINEMKAEVNKLG